MLDAAGTELQRFDPHSLGLQFPLMVGKEWQGTCRRFDAGRRVGTFVGTYKVTAIETVTVAAGTFRAFRVEGQSYEVQAPAKQWHFALWYAPEARMDVKLLARQPDLSVTEFEVVEFRPGRHLSLPPPGVKQISDEFLGLWEGYWKEIFLATRLTVERIEGANVTAVYWQGTDTSPGLQRPGQQPVEGKFLDAKTMRFEVWDDANQRWAEAIYTLNNDETLIGTWKSGGVTATGVLKKEP
jgi:hypothetical protein